MKSVLYVLLVCYLLISCEGSGEQQGPVNPPEEQGEQGESDATTILLTGKITGDSYPDNTNLVIIHDARIKVNDVIQAYISLKPDGGDWLFYPTFMVKSGKVSMYDPEHKLPGWYYLILIIKN
ncbi:hypothetical protein ES708_19355 [subsurface metagenome]